MFGRGWVQRALRLAIVFMMIAGLALPLGARAQDATPAATPATQWEVNGVTQSRFTQRSGDVAYPSPDGRFVAFASPSGICIDDRSPLDAIEANDVLFCRAPSKPNVSKSASPAVYGARRLQVKLRDLSTVER